MKEKKLLFFDIDGTLLDEKTHTVPQSTIRAFNQVKKKGHLIFINTGRPISTIDQCIWDLEPDGFICGCGTYITYHKEVLYQHTISQKRCLDIVRLLKNNHVDGILESHECVYFDQHIYSTNIAAFRDHYIDKGFNVKTFDDPHLSFDKFCIEYDHDITNLRKDICQDFDIIDRSADFLEIVPKDHSKATGIQFIVDYFHNELDNCYVFGDSFNDEAMLKYVKHSIVMKNGDPEMFEFAYYVTKDIQDDGIEHALQHFQLI